LNLWEGKSFQDIYNTSKRIKDMKGLRQVITTQQGEMWGMSIEPGKEISLIPARLPAEFKEIDKASAGILLPAAGEEQANEIKHRFQRGKRCFVGLVEGKLACWGWVSHEDEWIGEMKVTFRLEEGEAYIWDCVTLPDFRRQGLFSALINHMARDLQKEGMVRVWIGSNLENQPSIKGFKKAGYQPVMLVLFVQVLGMRFFKFRRLTAAPEDLVREFCRAFETGRAVRWARGCVNSAAS
jgi:ribosomal protein S18 acetylase RimI-like enzyme